jgi:hypothetical protein
VATGIEINAQKSAISFNGLSEETVAHLKVIFPFKHFDIQEGFRYLRFILKPNGYRGDWGWLLGKIEKRIHFWCNRWLSRGGRLTLIKAVLEAIPVY